MPHIHTADNEHDLTVTAYVVRVDGPEPKALVHLHKKHGVLLPPGGHVELSETPWQAMSHELAEEAGYDITDLKILQPKSRLRHMTDAVLHPYPISMNTHPIPDNHFHTDIEYGFVANSQPTLELAEGESTDIRWLTKSELNALDTTSLHANTREVYTFILERALEEWEQVSATTFR